MAAASSAVGEHDRSDSEPFAAGAILTMLTDTMLPEAVEGGGATVGLVTVLGFTLAFLLSQAQ